MPDGGGRLLKLREGHNKAPNRIRFYGSLGTTILSAGKCEFSFQKKNASTAHYLMRFEPN